MRRRILAALIMIPALALGLPACGGDDGGKNAADTKAAAQNDDDAKKRKYAGCLRANGVNMKDPEPGGDLMIPEVEGGKQKTEAAEAKCRHLKPNAGVDKKPSAKEMARMRALAKCLRA